MASSRSPGRSHGFGFVEAGASEASRYEAAALLGREFVETEKGEVLVEQGMYDPRFSGSRTDAGGEPAPAAPETSPRQLAVDLLGGSKVLGAAPIHSDEQAHARVLKGIPARALVELVTGLEGLSVEDVLAVLQVSPRSFARRRTSPKVELPLDEAGRVWRFAEILAQAIGVFGTRAAAEAWLARPAIGLGKHRPIELLSTPPGASLVSDHLTRLEYGVYT